LSEIDRHRRHPFPRRMSVTQTRNAGHPGADICHTAF
jgi:hypothetical protein